MKKLITLVTLMMAFAYLTKAGEVSTLPATIVVEIESQNGNGTVSVTGATAQTTNGNFTYAICDIETEISLVATPNSGYIFQEWTGNDPTHPYNLVPTDAGNPFTFTLFTDAGFIELMAGTMYLDTIKVKARFRDATVCNKTFTISEHGFFVTVVDAMGSTLAIDSTTVPPTIKYDQIKKDNVIIVDWPWNDVTLHFTQDPTPISLNNDVQAIQITYKVDHVWKMALPFNAGLMSGGGNHMVDLPASPSGFSTYTAYIDQFVWPVWYTDHQTNLNMDSVMRITFALDDNPEIAAYKGNLQIESIKLCGVTNLDKIFSIGISDQTINYGNSTQLLLNVSGVNPSNCTYQWSPTTGLSSSTVQSPIVTPTTTTTYYVTVTNNYTYETATASVVVTVKQVLFGVTLGTSVSITCGNSVQLQPIINGVMPSTCTYKWSPSNGISSTTIQSPLANPISTTKYTVTVTNASLATATASIIVNVTPNIDLADLGADKTFCVGQTLTLSPVNSNGTISSYNWSNGKITSSIQVTALGTYTLTVTDTKSCTASDKIIVSGSILPTNVKIAGKKEVGLGEVSAYTVSAINASSFYWEIDNGTLMEVKNTAFVAFPNTTSISNLKVVAYPQNGFQCSTEVILPISVKPEFGKVIDTVYVSAQTLTYLASVVIISNDTSSNIVTDAVAIKDGQDLSSFTTKVFPNPVTETLQVDLTAVQTGSITLKLWSTSGSLIYSKTNTGSTLQQIPMTSVAKGIYVLEVTRNGKVIAQKAVSKM